MALLWVYAVRDRDLVSELVRVARGSRQAFDGEKSIGGKEKRTQYIDIDGLALVLLCDESKSEMRKMFYPEGVREIQLQRSNGRRIPCWQKTGRMSAKLPGS
jgi:hypothetical protein